MLVGQVSYLPGNWQLGKPPYALFEHERLANLQWVDLNRGAGLDQALEFLRVCLQGMHRNGVFRLEAQHGFDSILAAHGELPPNRQHCQVDRLRSATTKDSTVNALVHLDVFAKFLTPPLEDTLNHIKPIFDPFLVKFTDRPDA